MMTFDTTMMLAMFWLAALPLAMTVIMTMVAIRDGDDWLDRAWLLVAAAATFTLSIALVGLGIEHGYPGTIVVR